MGNTRPEADIARAKALRESAKRISDPQAKQDFLDAAGRVERNAGRKVKRVGRRLKKGAARATTTARIDRPRLPDRE